MNGIFERAWLQLVFKIDHDHRRLIMVVGLKIRHEHLSLCFKPYYQNRLELGVFLQPQRLPATGASASPKPTFAKQKVFGLDVAGLR